MHPKSNHWSFPPASCHHSPDPMVTSDLSPCLCPHSQFLLSIVCLHLGPTVTGQSFLKRVSGHVPRVYRTSRGYFILVFQ